MRFCFWLILPYIAFISCSTASIDCNQWLVNYMEDDCPVSAIVPGRKNRKSKKSKVKYNTIPERQRQNKKKSHVKTRRAERAEMNEKRKRTKQKIAKKRMKNSLRDKRSKVIFEEYSKGELVKDPSPLFQKIQFPQKKCMKENQ